MLVEATSRAFNTWLSVEENHSEAVRKRILDVAERTVWYTSSFWKEALAEESGKRLLRGRETNDHLFKSLSKIKMPNVVLHLSNAPMHEVEQRVKNYITTLDSEKRRLEKERVMQIVRNYHVATEMTAMREIQRPIGLPNPGAEEVIQRYTLHDVKVEMRLAQIKEANEPEVVASTNKIFEMNAYTGENDEIGLGELSRLLENFRQTVAQASRRTVEDIEVIFDLGIRGREEVRDQRSEKRGPGRPKKEKHNDPGQRKIDEMFR